MSSHGRWMNRFGKRSAIVLAAASAVGGMAHYVLAISGTFTYTAGGTSWTNSSAWLFGNPFPNGPDEIANFTAVDLAPIGPIVYPITVDTNIAVGAMHFADANTSSPGGYLLAQGGSSTLTLANSNTSQPIINVGNMGNNAAVSLVDIAVPLYGTAGFAKQGVGLLRLSGNNGLSGSISIQGGTLEVSSVNNLGTLTDSTIVMAGGTLSLRSDTALNLSSRNLVITANSALDVNRSATNSTSTVTGIIDSIGTVTMGSGSRALTVTGSNFFGASVGTLVLDAANSGAIINALAPGQLTIGNVIGGAGTASATLTFGGTNNITSGNNLVITNSIAQTNAAATLSVVYSDAHTLTLGSFVGVTGNLIISGNGTLVVNAGRLPTGSLNVSNGTLDFSATNLVSTVTHLLMGGGTASYINTGAGTTSGLQVSGNVTFSSSTGGLGGVIDGRLLLGSGSHSIQVNGINGIPTQELTINAITSGSGTLNKGGTGQILLSGDNALSGALIINQGTFAGVARASGNALTTGAVTISGGALRLVNQGATPGSGSIGSLDFNGAATNPAFLVVDSGVNNATTTLNIGTFLGRAPSTTGALTIIPQNGGLGTTEKLTTASMAPAVSTATNHGILAPYVAAQVSASDSSIDFLASSGTQILGGSAAYQTGDPNLIPANSVYSTTTAASISGSKQMFALKADGTAANLGGDGLVLGDGTLAGLILNNGASVTASSLSINANEAIFWAGGRVLDLDGTTVLAAGGTIGSNVSFATTSGALTTSGSQTLTFSGGLDLSGQTRTITVSSGTAVLAGAVSNGSMIKSGPNYLIMTDANPSLSGTLNVSGGTLQIGLGDTTPTAGIGSAKVVIGNGNVVLNLDGTHPLDNFFTSTGTGALIVDSPTGTISLTNATSSFSRLTINSGALRLTGNNQIPSAASLTVQGTGSFDMSGFVQTIGSLAGTTGTGVISNSGSGLSTLTINSNTGTLTPTFSGQILGGVGGIALVKNGAGTQILGGASNYAGGTRLMAGTLQLVNNTGAASNSSAAGTGSIQFLGGNLVVGNAAIVPNLLTIGNSTGTVSVLAGGNTGTLSGPIAVSGGTLAVVFGGNNGTLAVLNTGLDPANFNGTVAFFSSGSGTGTFRLPVATNAGSTAFNLGTAGVTLLVNNSATFGTILGGNNATLSGGALNVGFGGGSQTFLGVVAGGGALNKIGSGTFTLTGKSLSYTGATNVNGGTLVFGNNAVIAGSTNLNINGGNLAMAGNATITSNANINLSEDWFFDVTQVPGGFSTPPTAILTRTGNVNGAYIHGAGTMAPGGFNVPGTITFNTLANPSVLTLGAGVVNLDIKAAGATQVGGATNDLIVVNGDVAFSPNTLFRVNYIGNTTLTAGEDYPILFYTGSKSGWGAGNNSITSGIVSSPFRSRFSLQDLGGGVVAAHVDAVNDTPNQSMKWTGSASNLWDLNITKNFSVANVATTFFQQDTVTFDNAGSSRPSVTLTNAIYLPAAVIFNNGSNVVNYNLSGPGTISGSTGILVEGTGIVQINNQHNFTGNMTISSGQVVQGAGATRFGSVVRNSPLGSGTVVLGNVDGTATLSFSGTEGNDIEIPAGKTGVINVGNGTQFFNGNFHGSGTLIMTGQSTLLTMNSVNDDFHGTVIVNSNSMNVRLAAPNGAGNDAYWVFLTPRSFTSNLNDASVPELFVGGLVGSGVLSAVSGGASIIGDKSWTIGGSNQDSTWNGGITNGSNGSNGNGITAIESIATLTKDGSGQLLLTGSNLSYTGETVIRKGTLELSNTGGPNGSSVPGAAALTGTRAIRVQNGALFRLGTPGGGVIQGNAGTITTATTGLLLTADAGGVIDVTNAYDGDAQVVDSETVGYDSFLSAPGVTWAGNGTILGNVRHEAGTLSPGRDTGAGALGTLTFANTLKLYGGSVVLDVGSTASSTDRINADTLQISGSTVVVNVIGNSIGAGGTYTFLHSSIPGGSTTDFGGLVVNGRGATGTFQQSFTGTDFMVKMLTPAVSAQITWNGGAGGTWDVKGGQNWLNNGNPDYFYHGDTVTFTDQGAGTINLAGNLTVGGQVTVNNTSTTYTFVGRGKITGNTSLHKMGAGTLVITTDNDYTGGTTIDAGGALAIGRDNVNGPEGQTYSPSDFVNNGNLMEQNRSGSLGSGSIVNNGVLIFRRTNGMIVNEDISGSGSVYQSDYGVTVLNGSNTYTGGTTVTLGTLKLGHANALPTAGSITLVGTTNFIGGTGFNGSGRGGRLDLNGFAQTIEELNSIGDGGTPGRPQDAYVLNSATLISDIATLTISRTGPAGFNSGIHNGVEGNNNPAGEIALVKVSPGVATMNYTNTGTTSVNYSGRTTINGGTLLVRGTHNPAGGVLATYTINSGAALAGDGNINTQIDVVAGGTIAPGVPDDTVYGTLNVSSLSISSGSINYELHNNQNDLLSVNVDNGFIPSGSNLINLNVVGGLTAGTFNLLEYGGAVIPNLTGLFSIGSITNGSTFSFALNSNTQSSKLELIVTQPIVSATWQTDGDGTWSTGSNWTTDPTTPNAFGSTANFGSISSPRTVLMDGAYSIGTANFTSASPFTITGTALTTLTFGNLSLGAMVGINVTQGSHTINVPVIFNNDSTISVAAGATLSMTGGYGLLANGNFAEHNVLKTGAGTLVVDNIRSTFGNNGAAVLNVSQGTLRMAHHSTANAAEGTSKVNSLAIASGAKLDLTNNSLVLDYTASLGGDGSAVLAQLRGWLRNTDGRLYSSDADSTHAIGYKDNLDASGAANKALSNFGGVAVDATSILLKYTYRGDTNLDGAVDLSDLYNIATNYNPKHLGSPSAVWQKGDSNYDGWVDLTDLSVLAVNWQAGVGSPLSSPLGPILASLGLPQISVPEPTGLGMIGLTLSGLLARRRRRRK